MNDANALLAALKDRELDEQAASAVALLALVAGQDVEPAEGSDGTDGRWRIARKVAEDRVISTVDPEARHTRKSPENRRDGYRAHVVAVPGNRDHHRRAAHQGRGEDNSDAAVAAQFLAGQAAGGGPAGVVWRFGLRHRGPARGAGRGRAHGGHQAQAAQARRRGRVHRR